MPHLQFGREEAELVDACATERFARELCPGVAELESPPDLCRASERQASRNRFGELFARDECLAQCKVERSYRIGERLHLGEIGEGAGDGRDADNGVAKLHFGDVVVGKAEAAAVQPGFRPTTGRALGEDLHDNRDRADEWKAVEHRRRLVREHGPRMRSREREHAREVFAVTRQLGPDRRVKVRAALDADEGSAIRRA